MILDHEAIRKAYPSITTIDDSFVDYGLDASGNKVTLVQSAIDTARTTLNAEAAKIAYQSVRQPLYPSLGDFAESSQS